MTGNRQKWYKMIQKKSPNMVQTRRKVDSYKINDAKIFISTEYSKCPGLQTNLDSDLTLKFQNYQKAPKMVQKTKKIVKKR